MNFLEWSFGRENIFQDLASIDSGGVVDTIGVDNVFMAYSLLYGGRTVPNSIIRQLDQKDIAQFIHNMYSSKWENIYISIMDSLPEGYDSEIVYEESYVDNDVRNSNNSDVRKVTAFNDDDFVNDNSTDKLNEETTNRDRLKQSTEKKRSLYSIDKRRKMMDNESVIKIVCDDVAKVLGLSIY